MLLELGQVHAAVALHAVAHIPAKALAQPTQVAERAVVDVTPRLIIEQLADVAVVTGHGLMAGLALGCRADSEAALTCHMVQHCRHTVSWL